MNRVEPDEGGFISGPTGDPPGLIVEFAVQAFHDFAGSDIDKATARECLRVWHRRGELSPQNVIELLDQFPTSGGRR